MKNSKIFLLLAFLTAGLLVGQDARAQRGGAVNFQYFYNELSPYGNWTSHPRYGSVWTPFDVGRNFQPYGTDGRWVMTEFGNTWVSDFAWGWAAFHYGRWFFDDYLGWAWVPGYEWGPAWVDWRSNNNYYGWAPMWPGVGIGVSFNMPLNYWVFIPRRHLFRRNVFGYCVPRNRYRRFFGRTTVINNYFYNDNRSYRYSYGPSRREVERSTRGSIPTYRADEVRSNRLASNRGSGNSSRTYRADDHSRSGLTRESRNYGGSSTNGRNAGTSGRSSRSDGATNGRRSYESSSPSSGRTYDATDNSRSRSSSARSSSSIGSRSGGSGAPSYNRSGNSRRSRSSSAPAYDSNDSRSRSSSTPSYNRSSRSRSSSPSVSSPSGNDSRSRYSAPATRSAPSVRSAPSRSRSSSSRSSSSYSAPSRSSAPAVRSRPSSPSRSSAPAVRSQPSRSSAPAVRSRPSSSSRSSAPRSGSSSSRSSSSSSSSSRSRGPR